MAPLMPSTHQQSGKLAWVPDSSSCLIYLTMIRLERREKNTHFLSELLNTMQMRSCLDPHLLNEGVPIRIARLASSAFVGNVALRAFATGHSDEHHMNVNMNYSTMGCAAGLY